MMKQVLATIAALLFGIAIVFFSGFHTAESKVNPAIEKLGQFTSKCGYLTRVKNNGGERVVVVVGEYHRFDDVQKDVECLMKQVIAAFPDIQFLGKEGLNYEKGVFYQSNRPKLNLGVPLIGIEGESWKQEYGRIAEIDDRHAALSKKKMDVGLTPEEYVEYNHVSQQSYEIILRKRSWEWVDNVDDFMTKTGMIFGLINTGFGHFPTMAERFDHYGVSYVFLMPNAAQNYCTCEAYWQKTKPNKTLSCKAVCENPAIKPRWD